MTRLYSLLLLAFLSSACNSESANDSAAASKAFFDLAGYVNQQKETAPWASAEITKTVMIGDKKESKILQGPDLNNDLKLFSKADINKPAWVDKYRIEVSGNDTSYIATDSSMRTQHLQVLRDANNEIERLEIKRRSGNVLSSGQQELTYRPASGYRIYSNQVGDLVGSAKVIVTVKW